MSSYVGQFNIDNTTYPVGSMLYGTCGTEASTAAKVATLSAFDTLGVGVTVHIKFTYSNTASSPTLKVGSTDPKPIMQYGSTAAGTTEQESWKAGAMVSFTYDGTNWVMNSAMGSDGGELPGVMHLIGETTTVLDDGETDPDVVIDGVTVTASTGDVVLYGAAEFVWVGTHWKLLGDEDAYALKSSTVSVGSASDWNAGSASSMTKTDVTIPNVTDVGSPTTASVANGTLTIGVGSAPTLGTAIGATHIDSWTAGTAPSLTVTPKTVVKP